VTDLVRTIDLGPWFGGDRDALEALLHLVDGECRRVGFLRLTGHGVEAELMDRMLATTSAFFDRPEDEKLSYVLADKARNRGYAAYGSEALAYSLGVDAKPDMFEAFNCGVEVANELDPYIANERHRMFAENVWPDRPAEMREVWTEYFDACRALAAELMRMFALALDMPESYLAEQTSRGPSVMRANNYERRSEHPTPVDGQLRMGAHSDYGVCTLLLADPEPGLQIVGPDGAWHDVLPEPGTFLVNLGDLLAEWTNDRWRSTVHRVVPPKGIDGPARRRSIAFFFEANYDAVVSVMPTCVGPDGVIKYAPITAGEHLMNKLMGPRTMQPSTADQSTLGDRRAAVTEV
jgi:isopenicillin N synthase-like dioxygenase